VKLNVKEVCLCDFTHWNCSGQWRSYCNSTQHVQCMIYCIFC